MKSKTALLQAFACLTLFVNALVQAEVSVPSIFSDHMVLQRDLANPVWGKASPGEPVKVSIADQSHMTTADADGRWWLELDPMPAGGPFELIIEGKNKLTIKDVLVGEVWMCSGQSNMEWTIRNSNEASLEVATANYPEIRIVQLPHVGTQDPKDDFKGEWVVVSPKTIARYSAVGYFFGRRLYHALDVPIGLIDNNWGGSNALAWIPREVLESDGRFDGTLAYWDRIVSEHTDEVQAEKKRKHQEDLAAWEAEGRKGPRPRLRGDPRYGQGRPGNIYNGMINPILGYGMRGVIWYQGESNAGQPEQYSYLFPLVIETLREDWGQGNFPFYWVQLADFRDESAEPQESRWAELRESQTMSLDVVPNSGQAVIIDAGEGRDIHPRDKQTVANRLARIALARDYGKDIHYQSPRYQEMTIEGSDVLITFDYVTEKGLYAFDTKEVLGFTIAGEDGKFYPAKAEIVGKNRVRVSSDQVAKPVAVRYGWADNPVLNLYDRDGLPVTPFRTDN